MQIVAFTQRLQIIGFGLCNVLIHDLKRADFPAFEEFVPDGFFVGDGFDFEGEACLEFFVKREGRAFTRLRQVNICRLNIQLAVS